MDGDLISRRAMLEILNAKSDMAIATPAQMIYANVAKIVELQPAVDADPVRHGRWEHGLQCPFCNQIDTTKPNYCPNCGAKMDEEDMKDGKAN